MGAHRAKMFRWSQNPAPTFPAKEVIPDYRLPNTATAGGTVGRVKQTQESGPGAAEQRISGSQVDGVAVEDGEAAIS